MILGDATTWFFTYDHHSDNSRGVIFDRNILIIQATGDAKLIYKSKECYFLLQLALLSKSTTLSFG
jgi:hypothetical protein